MDFLAILMSSNSKRSVTIYGERKKYYSKVSDLKKEVEPKPQIVKNCIRAFLVGGLICDLGQIIMTVLKNYDFSKDEIGAITSICMVFLGALLTGVGIYDKIAAYAGAGTVVPITGFSNA